VAIVNGFESRLPVPPRRTDLGDFPAFNDPNHNRCRKTESPDPAGC
jgi:hypothetical protein